MNDESQWLSALEAGDPITAEGLLPLVYDHLKALAAKVLAGESPGQTLSPTALVHEAYLRMTKRNVDDPWEGKRHFINAAAQAMRRIMIESARKKADRRRLVGSAIDFDSDVISLPDGPDELLALDSALTELAVHDSIAAKLVELRFFAGLTQREAAAALQLPDRTADRTWALAKTWLYQQIHGE